MLAIEHIEVDSYFLIDRLISYTHHYDDHDDITSFRSTTDIVPKRIVFGLQSFRFIQSSRIDGVTVLGYSRQCNVCSAVRFESRGGECFIRRAAPGRDRTRPSGGEKVA